jgi:hypothetical protein
MGILLRIFLLTLSTTLIPFSVEMMNFPYQDKALKEDEVLHVNSDEGNKKDDLKVLAAGTKASALEFTGNLAQASTKMHFGVRKCSAIFTLPLLDQGLFVRVCGCSMDICHFKGHSLHFDRY